MSKQQQVLGCFSKQPQFQNVVRSMLHLLCKIPSSGLTYDWVYSHQDSVNVCILDLDCASSSPHAVEDQSVVVVAISSHPERLTGKEYTLKKPLRSRDLLRILKNIEGVLTAKVPHAPHDSTDAPIVPVELTAKTKKSVVGAAATLDEAAKKPTVEVTPVVSGAPIVESAAAPDNAAKGLTVEVTPAPSKAPIVEATPELDDATAAFMKRYVKNVSDNDPVVRRAVAERRAPSTQIGKKP